jgi:hypothetical protein
MLESGTIDGQPEDLIDGKKLVVPNVGRSQEACQQTLTDDQSEEVIFAESAINASIVVCLALVTKNHLLGMWGLSEE